MNKHNAKDFLPLAQALADGKTIQMLYGGVWRDVDNVILSHSASGYRIKPKPEQLWVHRIKHCGTTMFRSEEALNAYLRDNPDLQGKGEIKKFVEEV